LAGLYKKYSDQGFHIIAFERQGTPASDVENFTKARKVPYQVTEGGNLTGATGSGLPQSYLLGPDGKLAGSDLSGKPLEDKIKLLIKDASVVYPGAGPYKKLAQLAAQVKTGRNLGAVLKQITAKKDSKDAEESAEAKMMFDAVHGAAEESLTSATAEKESDPVTAIFRLDNLTLRYDGCDIAATAKKESDALKKDPKVKKEMDAEAFWQRVVGFQDQLKAVGGTKDPKNEGFKKANAQAIPILIGGCQQLMKQFPDTVAAKKADQVISEYR
jgi:hypothetical protein